jgi:mono/diheme cytochrome c family protein
MKSAYPAKAWIAAILVATGTLTSTFATASVLRRKAALVSHQQPVAERLFEPRAAMTPELVARGRTLYLDSCAQCHAADARGDEGPDLHGAQVSDRYITRIIRRGIPHEMPSFAKKHGADDIRALIAYVRSLE